MTSAEKSTTSCETGSHYEGDFSYFSHLENSSDQEGPFYITCPECEKDVYVYHFNWTALKCQHCGAVVEKDNWNIDEKCSCVDDGDGCPIPDPACPLHGEAKEMREGTYDYYLRRMKEENALKKQVGGDHYKDCGIQPVEYIFQNKLDYFEGNVVKYITRHRKKGEGKKDVEKAIHYAQLILELYYNE